MKLKAILASLGLAGSLLLSAPAQAIPVLGNLNDSLTHTSGTTGFWSLFVNAGDFVTVTARRLVPVDIWSFVTNGAEGAGSRFAAGDDNLPPFVGGPWGDPQYSFTAATTGEYSVFVGRCCGNTANENISYFVSARGATGNAVPLPGTLALLGLGLFGLAAVRSKTKAD